MEAAAASQAMFTMSTAVLLLSANQMRMLDTTPVRAQRRWQRRPDRKGTDLFDTMQHSWPRVGVAEQDKNYTQKFRIDKQTFDMLHSQIGVKGMTFQALCLPQNKLLNAATLCRTSSANVTGTEMIQYSPRSVLLSPCIGWQMVVITLQWLTCFAWACLQQVSYCMRLSRYWMTPCSTEWSSGQAPMSCSKLWLTWKMSITCRNVLEPSTVHSYAHTSCILC